MPEGDEVMSEVIQGWIIQEWPHSAGLGDRWFAFPAPTPADEPWPGLKGFATRTEAVDYAKSVVAQGINDGT